MHSVALFGHASAKITKYTELGLQRMGHEQERQYNESTMVALTYYGQKGSLQVSWFCACVIPAECQTRIP